MSDLIAALPVLDTGAVGLLVLVFLAVIAGRLIPKSSHDREINTVESSAKREVETLQRALDSRTADNRQLIGYVAKMLPLAETSAHLLKSMTPEGEPNGNGNYDAPGPRGGGDSNG